MACKTIISNKGLSLIISFESWTNKPYRDNDGNLAIGCGCHVNQILGGNYIQLGKTYSDEQITGWIRQIVEKEFSSHVRKVLKWNWSASDITQSMFDAMVSACWSGTHTFDQLLLPSLKQWYTNRNRQALESAWQKYAITYKSGGVTKQSSGLRSRRTKEVSYFFTPDTADNKDFSNKTLGLNNKNINVNTPNTTPNYSNAPSASYESNAPTVLASSSDNIYSSIGGSEAPDAQKHTRIYKYSDFQIQLSEMSLNIDGTGTQTDNSNTQDNNEIQEITSANIDQVSNDLKGTGTQQDLIRQAGIAYPIIKINNLYLSSTMIEYVELDNSAFVPTIYLRISTREGGLLKTQIPQEGDMINLFCRAGHGFLKSLRCDFIITNVINSEISEINVNAPYNIELYGELYVPNLRNSNMNFSFAGTSRDALINASEQLKLGFFFCDAENTNDAQIWYCMEDPENETSSSMIDYIQNVTQHAWKDDKSFFDCWIDFRYGLTFLNMNKMLGAEGLDEEFDVAFFNTVYGINSGIDAHHGHKTDSEKKASAIPQVKLITNLAKDEESTTPFYAKEFHTINRANEITQQIGTTLKSSAYFENQALNPNEAIVPISYSIIYNHDKYKPEESATGNSPFYILIGPGDKDQNEAAKPEPYVSSYQKIAEVGAGPSVMSDGDQDTLLATGSNDEASGNENKFYDVAKYHNLVNNMQLQKKVIYVTLQGLNLNIMRGEKIPTIFVDNNKMTSMIGASNINEVDKDGNISKGTDMQRYAKIMEACVFVDSTGWFIIQSVKYVYNPYNINTTPWETQLVLTRREWPVPGYMNYSLFKLDNNNNNSTFNNTIVTDQPKTDSKEEEEPKEGQEDTSANGECPLTGLQEYLKDIYNAIKQAVGEGNVKLVGARRYPIDEAGNIINDGTNAYVKTAGGQYLCKDSSGKVLYVADPMNAHLYGEAMDIINGSGYSYQDLLSTICSDYNILKLMFKHGVSCFNEQSEANGTKTQHLHVGTRTGNEKVWWNFVTETIGSSSFIANGEYIDLQSYSMYSNATAKHTMTRQEKILESDAIKTIINNAKSQKIDASSIKDTMSSTVNSSFTSLMTKGQSNFSLNNLGSLTSGANSGLTNLSSINGIGSGLNNATGAVTNTASNIGSKFTGGVHI